jgi:tRNA-specific 2-thiouridylase
MLRTVRVSLREVNWIGGGTLAKAAVEGREIFVKLRSTQEPRPARLKADADGIFVELAEPEHGIAAGQACVFYADGSGTARVLGGGFISKASG